MEQRLTHGPFEFPQLLTEGGLTVSKRSSGPADTAGANGADEGAQEGSLEIWGHNDRLWPTVDYEGSVGEIYSLASSMHYFHSHPRTSAQLHNVWLVIT